MENRGGALSTKSNSNTKTTIPANTYTTVAEITGLSTSKTYLVIVKMNFDVNVGGTKPNFVIGIGGTGSQLETVNATSTGTYFGSLSSVVSGTTSVQAMCIGGSISNARATIWAIELPQ